MDERSGKVSRMVFSIVLSICSASIGFGTSQLSLAGDVHVTVARMGSLEERVRQNATDSKDRDVELERLVNSCMSLQQDQIKQGTELIRLLLQNQIRGGQ